MNPCDDCKVEGAPKCAIWDQCDRYKEWIQLRMKMIKESEPELSAPRKRYTHMRKRGEL